VRFASEGEAANGNVLLKHSEGPITGGRIVAKKEDDEDEVNEVEKPSKSKTKVKKEKDDDDMEMDAEEEKEEDFKPDEDGEEEQDEEEDEDEEGSSKKRKKKVSVNSCHLAHPVAYCRFLRPALRSQARKRRHQKGRMKMTNLQGSSSR
jgi:proliferating cell nuclear antigen